LKVLGNDLVVGTGTRALIIGEVQPAGKAKMASSAWINGLRLKSGESFE
jgi:methionyl-tRNA formyltransferase